MTCEERNREQNTQCRLGTGRKSITIDTKSREEGRINGRRMASDTNAVRQCRPFRLSAHLLRLLPAGVTRRVLLINGDASTTLLEWLEEEEVQKDGGQPH